MKYAVPSDPSPEPPQNKKAKGMSRNEETAHHHKTRPVCNGAGVKQRKKARQAVNAQAKEKYSSPFVNQNSEL